MVELGLKHHSLRLLSALILGLRVSFGKEINPPGTSKLGSSPAAISLFKSVQSFHIQCVFDLKRLEF